VPRITRIIVGVSGTSRGLPALRWAADLARTYQAELFPVHAWFPPFAAWSGYQFPSEEGPAGKILVQAACRTDDLLVIGTGRQAAVSRMWRGGVSRYCLARARCPVIAIPPPALERAARQLTTRPGAAVPPS
jgi:nucleotide-binding universal stress UspA family protein